MQHLIPKLQSSSGVGVVAGRLPVDLVRVQSASCSFLFSFFFFLFQAIFFLQFSFFVFSPLSLFLRRKTIRPPACSYQPRPRADYSRDWRGVVPAKGSPTEQAGVSQQAQQNDFVRHWRSEGCDKGYFTPYVGMTGLVRSSVD